MNKGIFYRCLALVIPFMLFINATGESPVRAAAVFNPASVILREAIGGFTQPIFITHAGDGSNRLFVVERGGLIRIVRNGVLLPTPFLDIHSRITVTGGEQGLLTVAFHPNYEVNGQFYTVYTGQNGSLLLSRFLRSATNPDLANPNSQVTLLTIPHPTFRNHNGGTLAFGPDGYLYWSTGDGGDAGDPFNNAQNLNSLLGKILRLDVNRTDPGLNYAIPLSNPFRSMPNRRGEIWAYGLRNPWRIAFDRQTGDLFIADVGQNAREEIDFQPATSIGGQNYGWRVMEGTLCFSPATGCNQSGKVLPVAEYSHSLGCSVTGGYIYRGAFFPDMQGQYFYGDFCSGILFSLHHDAVSGWSTAQVADTPYSITTFGEDQHGELYLTDYGNGKIYQICYGPVAEFSIAVAGASRGNFSPCRHQTLPKSFAGLNNGPVNIVNTDALASYASEQVIYKVNRVGTSFSEMMALPDKELDTTYWFPWYNNASASGLDTQLRFGNVSGSTATVHVYIGGQEAADSPFTLPASASLQKSFASVNTGPVQIVSDQKIVAAERVIYRVNGVPTSFTEMMGLPDSQLTTAYWLPWYNNVDLDTQLRFANVSSSTATVHVTVGGQEMQGSPFPLTAGQSTRVSFAGINNGPVRVESDVPIVAAERVLYKVNGRFTSFSEMMALPGDRVDTTYWFPWYDNVGLDSQLRFANVGGSTATVHIYIGGREMPGSPFLLAAGASTRRSFAGVNNGPVRIVSDVALVAAKRVLYRVNSINTSFSETMGLRGAQLDTVYWLPWYNNVDLETELRFGTP